MSDVYWLCKKIQEHTDILFIWIPQKSTTRQGFESELFIWGQGNPLGVEERCTEKKRHSLTKGSLRRQAQVGLSLGTPVKSMPQQHPNQEAGVFTYLYLKVTGWRLFPGALIPPPFWSPLSVHKNATPHNPEKCPQAERDTGTGCSTSAGVERNSKPGKGVGRATFCNTWDFRLLIPFLK